MNFLRFLFIALGGCAFGLTVPASLYAQEDEDELIIIDDDDAADEDELIIIDDEPLSATPQPSSGLMNIMEDHLLFRPRLRQDIFSSPIDGGVTGSLSSLELTSGWLGDDWGVHLNGLWRWWLPNIANAGDVTLGEWGAWYEFYIKQSWDDHVHLQLGKQMVPWGLTQVFSLGDRLQPSYRTPGIAFLEPVKGSEPLWGLALRSQLNIFSSELVVMMPWNAERNDTNVSSQGHFQTGRYQEGLNVGMPTVATSRYSEYMQQSSVLDQLALGGRIEGQVDEVTLGGSVVWGPDQTPQIIGAGHQFNALTLDLDPSFIRPDCNTNDCGATERPDLFRRDKVASLAVEATWSLGLAIFKLEWLHYLAEIPNMGKVVWLWGDSGLQSQHAAMDAVVVAMESGLGEWVEGSLEAGVFRWGQLPPTHQLFGVQALLGDEARTADAYYRPVVGARLHGFIWRERLSWSWVNETGVWTQDSQNKIEIALHWPDAQVYIGLFSERFEGPVGTPGYFRSGRDRAGIMIGGGPW